MFMQLFNIFRIIVVFILIDIYHCQVYIAQMMKLDVIFFVMGVDIYLVTTQLRHAHLDVITLTLT